MSLFFFSETTSEEDGQCSARIHGKPGIADLPGIKQVKRKRVSTL